MIIFHSEEKALSIMSWFWLPGTVVHELSHMLVAEIMGVRSGEFSFQVQKMADNKVRIGSVKIAKTDPFRQNLIGLAPMVIGLTIIFSLIRFIFYPILIFWSQNIIILLFCLYIFFIIGNTMFSSSKDLENILLLVIVFLLILGVAFLDRFTLKIPTAIFQGLTNTASSINFGLLIICTINLLLIFVLKLFNILVKK